MTDFKALQSRLAFGLSVTYQRPADFDRKKTEAIAEVIAKMTPAQQQRITEMVLRRGARSEQLEAQMYELRPTIEHQLNHDAFGNSKPANQFVSASGDEIFRGARYWLSLQKLNGLSREEKTSLGQAVADNDVDGATKILSRLGITRLGEDYSWALRIARGATDGGPAIGDAPAAAQQIGLRRDPVERLRNARAELEETLDRIHGEANGERLTELRNQAAHRFVALLDAASVCPSHAKEWRAYTPQVWEALFEALATAGAPGFVPADHRLQFRVEGLGLNATTRVKLMPSIQMVALAAQIEQRGRDPSYHRPGDERPVIPLALDEQHLGRPGEPLGFLSRDGKHAFIPESVDVVIVEHHQMGGRSWGDQLGFGELPTEDFHLEARYFGASLKLPVSVDVGQHRFALEHGHYRLPPGVEGAAVRVQADGVILSAPGAPKAVINPRTGEVTREA